MNDATCSSRSFISLMIAQFLGALNDNLFKTLVALLVLEHLVSKDSGAIYLALTGALFVLPYILFSGYAGYLSDRYSKSNIVKGIKLLEVVVMAIAYASFAFESTAGLLLSVFLMGLQSALFSPSKYGILPEMLQLGELSRANGFLEFWTFLGIIFGTGIAGIIRTSGLSNPGVVTLGVAIVGFIASLFVYSVNTRSDHPPFRLDPIGPNVRNILDARKSKGLFLSMVGIAFFWSAGQLFQLNILLYANQSLQIGDTKTSILLAVLGLGIGLGSIFAGKTSEGKVELGLLPLGACGLAITNMLFLLTSDSYNASLALVFVLGLSGGVFIVPVQTYLQEFSPDHKRGAMIAASNFMSFSCMFAASFLFWFLTDYCALSAGIVFAICGLLTVLVSIYLIQLLPEVLTRCINWILLHIIYRIEKVGREHIPAEGGALIVCNHVSYVDAQILLASLSRPVRFLMYRPIYEQAFIKPFVKAVGAIPIASEDGRAGIVTALQEARKAVQNGEIVGIFAEGGITRTGEMTEFKKGFETIMKGLDEPIIPAHLDGLWGSIFSFSEGKLIWKWPRKFPYPVRIRFGAALAAHSTKDEVKEAVQRLAQENKNK